jgi:hypothetical protein
MDLGKVYRDGQEADDQPLDVWAALQMRLTAALASAEHLDRMKEMLAVEVAEERLDQVGKLFGIAFGCAAIYESLHRRLESARASGDLVTIGRVSEQIGVMNQVLEGEVAPETFIEFIRHRTEQRRRGQA